MRIFWILFLFYQSLVFGSQTSGEACFNSLKAGIHGVVRDASGKIIRRTPLGREPIVIDTNVTIAIVGAKYWPDKSPDRWKAWASRVAKLKKNRANKVDDSHIYIADMTVKERFANSKDKKVVNTFPDNIRIFEIDVKRDSTAYKSVLSKFESMEVGEVKANSGNDRQIVTDLFFAKKNYPSDIPKFVTSDAGIYEPLCKLNPFCAKLNGDRKFIRASFPNGFDVTLDIEGVLRTIRVFPL